jgi:hypothetical protein
MHPQNISDLGLVYDRGLLPYDGFLTDYGRVPNNGLYGFNPRSLFANNEQGLWYDPSDLTPEKVSWRRNLLTYSQDFENAAWTKSNSSILSNLALYSQDFDNAYWVKASATVTANNATAPDGTSTADTVVGAAGTAFIYSGAITTSASTTYTLSFYVKAGTSTSTSVRVMDSAVTNQIARLFIAWSGGVPTLNSLTGWSGTPTVTDVGSGWYRFVGTFSSGVYTSISALYYPDANNLSANALLWGAQIVPGSTAQTYTRSLATAAPIQFADPLGGTLADKLVVAATTGQHYIGRSGSPVVTTAGVSYTLSTYAKKDERDWIALYFFSGGTSSTTYFNLTSGTVGTTSGTISTSITDVGGGWYRCSITASAGAASATVELHPVTANGSLSNTGDGVSGLYVYGAQVEQASTASAYQRITDFSSDFLAAFPTHALYQESTGVTPVTALGQSVGLVLDKRLGALTNLGPELVTNGTFDSGTTSWTSANSPGLNVSPSGVAITNNGATNGLLYQAIATTVGRSYLITGNILFGGGFARIETSTAIPTSVTGAMINVSASGRYQWYFTASVTTTYIVIGNRNDANAFNIYDNISVREVPGNHALQATSASRPTLQARSNLLTYSEQFDNAVWTKSSATISANTTVAPDGTTTADTLTASAGTGLLPRFTDVSTVTVNGSVYSASVFARAGTYSFVQIYLNNQGSEWANYTLTGNGTATANGSCTATISNVGSGWYRLTMTYTAGGTDRRPFFMLAASATATRAEAWNPVGTETAVFWGAQFELGTPTTYQRVVTATDYADVGLPRNLTFDGVDDSLATAGNVDFATWTVGSRRNLLTVPTMFDDAAWSKSSVSVTANATTAPDGTTTADKIIVSAGLNNGNVFQSVSKATSPIQYSFSAYVKQGEWNTAGIYFHDNASFANRISVVVNLITGAITAGPTAAGTFSAASGSVVDVGNGWWRVTATGTTGSETSIRGVVYPGNGGTFPNGDGTSGIFAWGAQLETGSTATAFQNVGTDKVSVFTGVTKLSDAAYGVIADLSTDPNAINGSFGVGVATLNGDGSRRTWASTVRGTSQNLGGAAVYASPDTRVMTASFDIAGTTSATENAMRLNGVAQTLAYSPSDAGISAFGSYVLYVGRRAGTSSPLNGRLFQLVIRGAATGSDTIRAAERWVGRLTGVQL